MITHTHTLAHTQLTQLVQGLDLGQLASLERLMSEFMSRSLIPQSVITALWDVYSMKAPKVTQIESTRALMILAFLADASPDVSGIFFSALLFVLLLLLLLFLFCFDLM